MKLFENLRKKVRQGEERQHLVSLAREWADYLVNRFIVVYGPSFGSDMAVDVFLERKSKKNELVGRVRYSGKSNRALVKERVLTFTKNFFSERPNLVLKFNIHFVWEGE